MLLQQLSVLNAFELEQFRASETLIRGEVLVDGRLASTPAAA